MSERPTLYTYTIPVDDGAAPNPFNGMCTLAICKPVIRRTAKVGDWVAGLGSKNAPGGNRSRQLVYAMRVDKVLSLEEYDRNAREQWPHRIPNVDSPNVIDRLGDCIYDFSNKPPIQRRGVHGEGNRKTDLGGENVLISYHYYYFGDFAQLLPDNLKDICHQSQGHKSHANDPYVDDFVKWIESSGWKVAQLYGNPDFVIKDWGDCSSCGSCVIREKENLEDIDKDLNIGDL